MVQNGKLRAAPPPAHPHTEKKEKFFSFSFEDRSSVFLLWAKMITSVSTYVLSEKRRFVNLTETMTMVNGEWRTKSHAD